MIDDIELKTIIVFSFTTKKFDTTKFLIKLFDANSVSVCVKWSEVKVTAFQYTFSNRTLIAVIYFIKNCIIYLNNRRKERSHSYITQDKKTEFIPHTQCIQKKMKNKITMVTELSFKQIGISMLVSDKNIFVIFQE